MDGSCCQNRIIVDDWTEIVVARNILTQECRHNTRHSPDAGQIDMVDVCMSFFTDTNRHVQQIARLEDIVCICSPATDVQLRTIVWY